MNPALQTAIRETVKDRPDGFVVLKQQDCEEIIKAIKSTEDIARRVLNTQHSQKYIGSVPNLIAVSWAEEWGVRPFSKEWLTKAKRRVKSDPNWSKLRAPQ